MSRYLFVALCAVALFTLAPFARSEDSPATNPSWTDSDIPENPVTAVYKETTEGMSHDEFLTLATERRLGKPCDKRMRMNDDGVYCVYKDWEWSGMDATGAEWHTHISVVIEDNKVRPTGYLAWKESPALHAL